MHLVSEIMAAVLPDGSIEKKPCSVTLGHADMAVSPRPPYGLAMRPFIQALPIGGVTMNHKELVAEIRRRFPNPATYAHNADRECYCVGGAFMDYIDHPRGRFPWRFPLRECLADALHSHTGKSRRLCERFADRILADNDRGDFDSAWQGLEDALDPRIKTTPVLAPNCPIVRSS